MNHRPLVIGEALFDQFPDGTVVLGGAPFNVAWHLHGMGLYPLFISATGEDSRGAEIRAKAEAWGMDTSGMQVSSRWPTGKVEIKLVDGQPAFTIPEHQSFDDIGFPEKVDTREFGLIYTGSLGGRFSASRSTIRHVISDSQLPVFVDINLRKPCCDEGWLDELMCQANWLKLNRDELAWITKTKCQSETEIGDAISKLRNRIGIKPCFVTCGEEGAYAMDEAGQLLFGQALTPDTMIDSVGAGDAFSAATIYGIMHNRRLDQLLPTAVQFAAKICTITGAVPSVREYYRAFNSDALISAPR